jgi:hypothetical protein
MSQHDRQSHPARASVTTTAPNAKTVFVAGTFNDWNPKSHPLTRVGDGRWALTLDAPPGRHEYKFIIDGAWCCEQGCDKPFDGRPECVANEMGTMNRVLVVGDAAAPPNSQRPTAGTLQPDPKPITAPISSKQPFGSNVPSVFSNTESGITADR